jgi:hypothetical protein
VLAAVMLTDIVDSLKRAAELRRPAVARAARTALSPSRRGIRLLGLVLSSLAEEEPERKPEFSLPR